MPACAGSERCESPCQAEADMRSAHRRAARVCADERAPDVLRLADGVGRFFKLVFLNSGEDHDRLAVCCQQTTIRTDKSGGQVRVSETQLRPRGRSEGDLFVGRTLPIALP